MTTETAPSIQITVLLFAAYREAVGERCLSLSVPEGTTAANAFDRISRDAPGLEALRIYTTFAINRAVCGPDSILHHGDEVAFLQPASGGSHD